MKKILLASYILVSATCLVAQNPPLVDSTDVQVVGGIIFDAAVTANDGKDLIKGVDNLYTGGFIASVIAFV